jgi:hypothetical protein
VFFERGDVAEKDLSPSWPEVVLTTVAKALTSLDAVLSGMVAGGLGAEAIVLYLGLSRTALFDRLALLGLPTPHERPLRRAAGKHPWTPADVRHLITGVEQ